MEGEEASLVANPLSVFLAPTPSWELLMIHPNQRSTFPPGYARAVSVGRPSVCQVQDQRSGPAGAYRQH